MRPPQAGGLDYRLVSRRPGGGAPIGGLFGTGGALPAMRSIFCVTVAPTSGDLRPPRKLGGTVLNKHPGQRGAGSAGVRVLCATGRPAIRIFLAGST